MSGKPRKLVRLKRVAERLDLEPSTMRQWFLMRKHLDWVKVGGAVCATEESIERFIDSNMIPAQSEAR